MRPSFIAQGMGGLFCFVAFMILFSGLCKGSINLNKTQLVGILLLLSIAISIHGLQHMAEEIYYDYNPLVGKWNVNDEPTRY